VTGFLIRGGRAAGALLRVRNSGFVHPVARYAATHLTAGTRFAPEAPAGQRIAGRVAGGKCRPTPNIREDDTSIRI
jgi:hypothetical protein